MFTEQNITCNDLQESTDNETKIVVDIQSDYQFKETEIPNAQSEVKVKNTPDNDYAQDKSKDEDEKTTAIVTATANIAGEIAVEFDKVMIVAMGTVKGKRKEQCTETINAPQDEVVRKKTKKLSLFGRDLQIYCAEPGCCMDTCCARFDYCCMGPQRNCFVAYMMTYYFVMQAVTSYLLYQMFLPKYRNYVQKNNNYVTLGSTMLLVLINYVMLCLACGNHVLLSFILLLFTVAAYSILLAALSLRFDVDLFWFANTTLAVVALFLLLLAITYYDFTNCRLTPYIVLVTLLSFFLVHYMATQNFRIRLLQRQYNQKTIILYVFIAILHALLLVTTLRRLLCTCFIEIGLCDYGIGAYIMYMMWMQQILSLLHMGSGRQ